MKPAVGSYHYFLDGKRQAIDEPFTIVEADSGFALSGQRIIGKQVVLEVRALYREGAWTELDLAWNAPERRVFQYRHLGAELEWGENGEALRKEPLPENCLLFPLLRAATGELLPRLNDKTHFVVVPNLHHPNSDDFLSPLQSKRHSEVDAQNPLHYRYYGGEYGDAGADYWLRDDGLVTRYRWDSPTGLWEVRLDN